MTRTDDMVGRIVWVLDLLSYDARGGSGDVYVTPEAAMDAASQWGHVNRWTFHVNRDGTAEFTEFCQPGSARDIWNIRSETIKGAAR